MQIDAVLSDTGSIQFTSPSWRLTQADPEGDGERVFVDVNCAVQMK